MGTTHVIGAGLAGLACAVRLVRLGRRVALYEAASGAGGRCRSYYDGRLGRGVDNGNHLLLSGNRAALDYLREIDAAHSLTDPGEAVFPFVDLASGERWRLRPGRGRLPWWMLDRRRRIPGTRARDYLPLLALAAAGDDTTVARCIGPAHPLYRPLVQPLTVAVLNADPEEASARLLWAALRDSVARGAAGCRPLLPRVGLSASFVDPALAYLRRRGVPVRINRRLRALCIEGARAEGLDFGAELVPLEPDDEVVLAVPPAAAAALLPGLKAPPDGQPIVNAHFRHDGAASLLPEPGFVGLLGGAVQWIFVRGDIISATVSAAGGLAAVSPGEVTALLWRDIARALDLAPDRPPPARIVKERRATFAQTPAHVRLRPGARTWLGNVKLAGDWTGTGLPATIEGAVRSGHAAAAAVNRDAG